MHFKSDSIPFPPLPIFNISSLPSLNGFHLILGIVLFIFLSAFCWAWEFEFEKPSQRGAQVADFHLQWPSWKFNRRCSKLDPWIEQIFESIRNVETEFFQPFLKATEGGAILMQMQIRPRQVPISSCVFSIFLILSELSDFDSRLTRCSSPSLSYFETFFQLYSDVYHDWKLRYWVGFPANFRHFPTRFSLTWNGLKNWKKIWWNSPDIRVFLTIFFRIFPTVCVA